MLKKIVSLLKQYKTGIFRLLLNRVNPDLFQYQTFLLFDHDLQRLSPDEWQEREDLAFRKITSEDDEWFAAYRNKFPAAEFLSRIRQENKTCFIALKEDRIAGYAWVSLEELFIETINGSYDLKPDELFIYACFVCPGFRGQGIYPDMLRFILKEYHLQGYRRACIGVVSANIGSIRGIKKCGFRESGELRYLRLAGLERRWGLHAHRLVEPQPATAQG